MCECEQMHQDISGLVEALRTGQSNDPWEYSEPFAVGGPNGTYALRVPFTMGDCQFKVDSITAGASNGVVSISPFRGIANPAMTAADTGTSELGAIMALLYLAQQNTTIPIGSEWYNVLSGSTVYVVISASTQAVYVNIKFRQKR